MFYSFQTAAHANETLIYIYIYIYIYIQLIFQEVEQFGYMNICHEQL